MCTIKDYILKKWLYFLITLRQAININYHIKQQCQTIYEVVIHLKDRDCNISFSSYAKLLVITKFRKKIVFNVIFRNCLNVFSL